MVNVKTSERFFCNADNVKAGTLINEDLVSPHYDFYIVSQQSNRGTSVPNHYKVIYNSSELEEGILQELAFSQCFNYVNWTGSIKVPAILQYAKKCCKFGAEVMECSEVPDCLWTRLYYI
jgi:aubergine-like protein